MGPNRLAPRTPLRLHRAPLRGRGWLALVLLFGLAGCEEPPPGVFRVGLFVLEDGGFTAASGEPTLRGASLYVDSVNANGGVRIGDRPYRVELVVERHSLQIEEVTTAARRLVSRARVDALVGPQLSDHAIPVGGIAERVPIPMISPMSSNPATTEDRDFVFRIAFRDDQQAALLAQLAHDHPRLGFERVGILWDRTSDYSEGIAEAFRERFEAAGGQVVLRDYPGRTTADFRPWLAELRDADIEALLLPLVPGNVASIMEQLDAMGFRTTLLGTDGWNISGIQGLPAAEGALVTHQWHPALSGRGPAGFVAHYTATYGVRPMATAALTFDAVRLIVDAAVAAGSTDPMAVRDALVRLPAIDGASGPVDFDLEGDTRRPVIVSRIVDGANQLFDTGGDPAPDGGGDDTP